MGTAGFVSPNDTVATVTSVGVHARRDWQTAVVMVLQQQPTSCHYVIMSGCGEYVKCSQTSAHCHLHEGLQATGHTCHWQEAVSHIAAEAMRQAACLVMQQQHASADVFCTYIRKLSAYRLRTMTALQLFKLKQAADSSYLVSYQLQSRIVVLPVL